MLARDCIVHGYFENRQDGIKVISSVGWMPGFKRLKQVMASAILASNGILPMHSQSCKAPKVTTVWEKEQINGFLRVLESGDTHQWNSIPIDFILNWRRKTRGGSVFHRLAHKGKHPDKCVPFLIDCGLDIHALTKRGRSVLEYALLRDASSGVEWARALIDGGFDLRRLKCGGSSLLSQEVSWNRPLIVQFLIQSGAPRASPDQGWAASQNMVSADAVQILIKEPGDAPSESVRILEDLLPASKNDIDRLFLYSVSAGRYQWARHWVRQGADIKAQNIWGDCALHLLAYMACTGATSLHDINEFLYELIEGGIDCESIDKKGKTSAEQFEDIAKNLAPRKDGEYLGPGYWRHQIMEAQARKIASETLCASGEFSVSRL